MWLLNGEVANISPKDVGSGNENFDADAKNGDNDGSAAEFHAMEESSLKLNATVDASGLLFRV